MVHDNALWRSLLIFLALSGALTACHDETPCEGAACNDAGSSDGGMTMDAGAHDAGAMDAGVHDAGTTDDAGQPDAGDTDAGTDAGTVTLLMDYVPCTLDIECPSGMGRCQKTLPFHHPAPNGATGVATSAVFTGLQPGQGICTETCELDPNACDTSNYLSRNVTYTCQVVAAALSPYGSAMAVDAGAMAAGQAFAAVCRPPLAAPENCGPCATSAECGAGTCWDLDAHAPFSGSGSGGACVMPCGANDACPAGFACANQLCLPLLPTCTTCADVDGDGRGVGFCGLPDIDGNPTVSAVDCDDADPTSYWHATLQCGPVDHDCNGFTDATDMVGTDAYGAEHCAACNDACPSPANAMVSGVAWACLGPVGARTCASTCLPGRLDCDATPGCEVDTTTPGHQFAPDQDNDGYACNPVPGSTTCAVTTACAVPMGYAAARDFSAAPSTCSASTCPDADEGHATVHPLAPELCDGLDNDQDGVVDDGFVTPGATICTNGTLPPCTGSTAVQVSAGCSATCGMATGAGTWACNGTGGVVCQPSTSAPELACNGIDDNCNGVVDEPAGDACGAPMGTLDSSCWREARQTCVGPTLTCVPSATSLHVNDVDLPGDAFDADCDGSDLQHDAVYVFSNYSGAATPNGSKTTPFKNLKDALTELDALNPNGTPKHPTKTLYLQDDTNLPIVLRDATLTLGAGRRVYGGFTGGLAWNPPTSTPAPTHVCMPPGSSPSPYTAPGGIARAAWVGLRCINSTLPSAPAVLRNVSLEVNKSGCDANFETPKTPPDPAYAVSAYGAVFTDCDELIWDNVVITVSTPPAPGTPATQTGANGNNGGSAKSTAGGVGGAGGSTVTGLNGVNGSTAAPTAPANTSGGAGGILNNDGSAPTTGGNRGMGGATSSYLNLLQAPNPTANTISYFLQDSGYVVFATPAQYRGGAGGEGARGAGGGGGGAWFNGLSISPGGAGGQGGGSGPGGTGGYAGGDAIGLVLLGTQLPASLCASNSASACGRNVTISTVAGGPGGPGGTGGSGGNGGNGSTNRTTGGAGGKACGGGGGAGGRGGLGLGVVGDLQSLTANNTTPGWLNVAGGMAGSGGAGGAVGIDGSSAGNYTCTNNNSSGATGRAGRGFSRVVLPLASCASARNLDTDFPASSAQWVIADEKATSQTCP